MKAKRIVAAVLVLILASSMFLMTACNRDAAQGGGAAANFNRDGILIFGAQGWDSRFNPIMSTNIYDAMVNTLIFQGLITQTPAAEPIGMLATHWEVSNEHLTYTFFIDPRAAFSDGRPLTAYDVEFTFTTMAHPLYDGPRTNHVQDLVGFYEFNTGQAGHVAGIRVIDAHTIAFDHTVASPQHIWNFGFGILCREHYAFEVWDDFMAQLGNPFGSGQFIMVDHVFQQWIEFERNENFWNPDVEINLAGIVMRDVPMDSIIPALRAGEIHFAELSVNMDHLEALRATDNVRYTLFVANNLRHVTFNTTRPHLSDHRVRQALAYAFDTRAYIVADTGSPDLRSVGVSPWAPTSWAFPGIDALNTYEFNMDRAHQLMDEAGWIMQPNGFRYKDGQRMRIHWLIYPEAAWPGIITGMASHTWGELGVELDIQMFDFATVGSMTTQRAAGEGDFDIFQMGWSMAIDPDLRGGLWDATRTEPGNFFSSGFTYQRLMDLIELGATTFDINERKAIYHEIAQITNYYLPVWVLSNGMNLWAFDNRVHNLEVGVFQRWDLALVQQGTWVE